MQKTVRRTLAGVVIVAAGAGLVLMLRPTPIAVDVSPVTVGPLRVTVEEEGRTRVRERYHIFSPLAGRLDRIELDPGDVVRARDTVVAVLEPTPPELLDPRAVATAEARVRAAEAGARRAESMRQRAQATYDLAETELGRVREAADKDAAGPGELDEAIARERQAFQELRAAGAEEDVARYELEVARSAMLFARGDAPEAESARMPLLSPIDGVVLRVFRESMSVVPAGELLLEVGDPSDLQLVVDVLSPQGVRILPGDRVIVTHWGGDAQLEARVKLVEPAAFTHVSALGIEEQRVYVIAEFTSPPEARRGLGDQFRVEASIVTWEADAVLQAPSSALFRDEKGDWAVFVVVEGRVEQRTVEIGPSNGEAAAITSGLAPDDLVVRHPSDQLEPGARIRIRP